MEKYINGANLRCKIVGGNYHDFIVIPLLMTVCDSGKVRCSIDFKPLDIATTARMGDIISVDPSRLVFLDTDEYKSIGITFTKESAAYINSLPSFMSKLDNWLGTDRDLYIANS